MFEVEAAAAAVLSASGKSPLKRKEVHMIYDDDDYGAPKEKGERTRKRLRSLSPLTDRDEDEDEDEDDDVVCDDIDTIKYSVPRRKNVRTGTNGHSEVYLETYVLLFRRGHSSVYAGYLIVQKKIKALQHERSACQNELDDLKKSQVRSERKLKAEIDQLKERNHRLRTEKDTANEDLRKQVAGLSAQKENLFVHVRAMASLDAQAPTAVSEGSS
ncbi:hypothetical protein EYR40_005791 [Pleurotus pulmonarius]|nr:hypothetical protein EYR40_005791 [Pleurotus pulmonarius]